MPRPAPPPLPPTPPTDWPAASPEPERVPTGWLGVPEREAWSGWQVALITVVALLAGLAIGVAVGLRMDRDDDRAGPQVVPADPAPRGPGLGGDGMLGDHLGSPDNPVPLGTSFVLGGYSLQVLEVDPDAGASIAELSDLNRAPRPGESYLLVTVELSYDGPLSGNPLQVLLSLVDDSGATYLEHRNSCGRIPAPLSAQADMAPGEAVTGTVCFAVPTDRVGALSLVAEVLAGFPVHYRLQP